MNDKRAVEVIERTIDDFLFSSDARIGPRILAALRAEGYDLYRPDDCEKVTICTAEPIEGGTEITASWEGPFEDVLERFPQPVCRLVPVGGEG